MVHIKNVIPVLLEAAMFLALKHKGFPVAFILDRQVCQISSTEWQSFGGHIIGQWSMCHAMRMGYRFIGKF